MIRKGCQALFVFESNFHEMAQQRRLTISGLALTGQVQRLFEELQLSGTTEFYPAEIVLELDTYAEHLVYIGWCNADGSKPAAITSRNGLPLEPEQIRTIRNDGNHPRADYRQLCWQSHADDAGKILAVSYWESIEAVNPL